jgi:tRNA wybutosine-synthesizing protein 2
MVRNLNESMSFKELIAEKTGIASDLIPSGYQIIGDIMLIKFSEKLGVVQKRKIASAVLESFPYVKTVCESFGVEGELRKPKVKIIKSREKKPKLITMHKEHDVLFKLDVSKIMFSKGNLDERQRLIKQVRPNETIVDMFAGIGYFSLGIAKFSPANRIYAIEKNKVAFKYLKESIKINKTDKVIPILGDCRRIRRKIAADRIILGYLPGTEEFLPYAFRFLKDQGIIHYHNIYPENELWKKPLQEIENAAKSKGFRVVAIIGRNIVKSYAPRVFHIVIDVGFERISK